MSLCDYAAAAETDGRTDRQTSCMCRRLINLTHTHTHIHTHTMVVYMQLVSHVISTVRNINSCTQCS